MDKPVVAQARPYIQETAAGEYFWCACGRSKSQPFCDGSHKGTGLSPRRVEIPKTRQIAWCGCKHSRAGHLCDGSHEQFR